MGSQITWEFACLHVTLCKSLTPVKLPAANDGQGDRAGTLDFLGKGTQGRGRIEYHQAREAGGSGLRTEGQRDSQHVRVGDRGPGGPQARGGQDRI